MERTGLFFSSCYDKGRSSNTEFFICLGTVPCKDTKQDAVEFVAAPDILKTPKGHNACVGFRALFIFSAVLLVMSVLHLYVLVMEYWEDATTGKVRNGDMLVPWVKPLMALPLAPVV